MNLDPTNYDEKAELTKYVWLSYLHLLTADEKLADNAFSVEAKLHDFPDSLARAPEELLKQRKRYEQNAYVQDALRRGYNAFQAKVRDRIVEESPKSFVVNRCPVCKRIIATPNAKQCLWCGEDWHRSD